MKPRINIKFRQRDKTLIPSSSLMILYYDGGLRTLLSDLIMMLLLALSVQKYYTTVGNPFIVKKKLRFRKFLRPPARVPFRL